MLTKIRTLASLFLELGPRWSAFRLAYAFRLRTGLIRLQTPQYAWDDRPLKHWLKPTIPSDSDSYAQWRKSNAPKFLFENVFYPENVPWDKQIIISHADRILSGEIKYFSHQFQKIGFPPKWHKNPVAEIELDSNKHWSQISDESGLDIKFVWEANRFSFVFTLIRAYATTGDEKYALAFWQLIEDWAEHNQPNSGPNWMDGQEIALRIMAWVFGYYQFFKSSSASPQRISEFTVFIASQAERIYKNIDYAISTRSNHTISEAFGLWLVGLLFPELKDSEKYFSLGGKILEQEAEKQFFPDGSYSMYSLNYHRFVLHIYLLMIRLCGLHNIPVSGISQKIFSSINYLSRLVDSDTGQVPSYGSNDGALVLPLNNCDFIDYRPLLHLGAVLIFEEKIFYLGDWDEDVFWFFSEDFSSSNKVLEINKNTDKLKLSNSIFYSYGKDDAPFGGVYILRNINSHAILRCTNFTSRPSHADQLHMDLWMGAHNIAIDAGTYLYSGEGIWRNGLARTSAHNTVTVDGADQMTLVSRFTWTNWAKGKVLKQTENLWQGEHDGYNPVRHRRTVMALEEDRWLVIDDLTANEPHHYTLHWLLNDVPFTQKENSLLLNYEASTYKIQTGLLNGDGKFTTLRADSNSTYGWRSRYYAHKEPAISLLLEAHHPTVRFWTFFGFESDTVKFEDKTICFNNKPIDLPNP